MKEKEPRNKVEIVNVTRITDTRYYDDGQLTERKITNNITNRVSLEGMGDDFLRDYFDLKVTIDWDLPKEKDE